MALLAPDLIIDNCLHICLASTQHLRGPKIWKFHQDYLCGLIHFLRSDCSVPEHLKELAQKVTFEKGIFINTKGWQHQLYIREALRMVSLYVLTQNDIEGETNQQNSVSLASYRVDEWQYAIIMDDSWRIRGYLGSSSGKS